MTDKLTYGLSFRLLTCWFALFAIQVGCKDDGCKVNSDCPSGELCHSGKCQSSPDGGAGDGDTDSDTDSDTDGDGDTDSDGDSDTDTSDGGDGSDIGETDSENCDPSKLKGEACTSPCQCFSGHCENNLCCIDGECCATSADCENDLCAVPSCDDNADCVYRNEACGAEDSDGAQTCSGDNVCNGEGSCVLLTTDECGNYTSADISCTANGATRECHTDCTTQNASVNCVEGAICESNECVVKGLDNGAACQGDDECTSGRCNNGFCCLEGECCGADSNCSKTLCTNGVCTGDHQCVYNFTGYSCGMEDAENGDTCTGDNRCDGGGNCVPLSSCDEAYAWNPNAFEPYVCGGQSATETCYEPGSCVNDDYCNDGYECDGSDCVFVGVANGGACTAPEQCGSQHCVNEVCCPSGDCCADDLDCTDAMCFTESFCGPDNMCQTGDPIFCSFQDSSCTGNSRCDGTGNCVPVTPCDGAYAWNDDAYSCSSGIVGQVCYSSCFGPYDGRCNENYDCSDDGHCVPMGLRPDGSDCAAHGECESGNCGDNGICCAFGKECCTTPAECEQTQCNTAFCTGNYVCDYQPLSCGAEDVVDELGDGSGTCTGAERCDGAGGCVGVAVCNQEYAFDETYTCQSGSVEENCYQSCSTSRQCNADYTCSSLYQCIRKEENGGDCDKNADCLSNYCTTATHICCDAGKCCNDNEDCGSYVCDTTAHSCIFSCIVDDADSDEVCAPLGAYHCDNGQCNEDLENGEWPCDEASDCASDHCDMDSQVCCDSGTCCADDEDCDGVQCGTDGQCGAGCTDNDDSMCEVGFHCDGDVCVEDISNGMGTCDEDSDCNSGNCTPETGVCCVEGGGDCCTDASQCDDGDACTQDECSAYFQCYFVPKSEGESCDDGSFCNGLERCDANGDCVPSVAPCTTDDICLEAVCDEQTDTCDIVPDPDMVGEPCSDVLFCMGNRAMECTEFGLCDDPNPTGPKGCEQDPNSPCVYYECDEENNDCVETAMDNGVICDDDDPCNGVNECWNGDCVSGPNLPCDDYNPCTEDICTNNNGVAECEEVHPEIADGESCNDNFACYGSDPHCMAGTCIPNESVCQDGSGICTIHECQEAYYDSVTCGDSINNDGGWIGCGETKTFDSSLFVTRGYFTYNEDMCPGEYPGPEAAIAVQLPRAGSVNVTVSSVSPAMDLTLMSLGNWCDENTCEQAGLNSLPLTVDGGGFYTIVFEADNDFPPDSFDVTVSACP